MYGRRVANPMLRDNHLNIKRKYHADLSEMSNIVLENVHVRQKGRDAMVCRCSDGAPFDFIKREREFVQTNFVDYIEDYESSVHLKDTVELHLSIKGNMDMLEEEEDLSSVTVSAIGFNINTRKIVYRVRSATRSDSVGSRVPDEAVPNECELDTMIADKQMQVKRVYDRTIAKLKKHATKMQFLEALESLEERLIQSPNIDQFCEK